ncbi:probable tRNA (uracil-O(2)-)-methyltransferase [Culicoides brevitarsis]|uniref:probable tRNA (uracil-O(2)-)-methyltransferase n=1 Tax=Culicoides brevitarsis TaxID=469753 RepID=UPI00307CA8ED
MILLKKEDIDSEKEAFFNTVDLILNNPDIISKGILSTEVIKFGKIRNFCESKVLKVSKNEIFNEKSNFWDEFRPENVDLDTFQSKSCENGTSTVVVRKNLLKNTNIEGDSWTVSFTDFTQNSVLVCRYKSTDDAKSCPYKLLYEKNSVSLFICCSEEELNEFLHFKQWLETKFFTKFCKILKNSNNFQGNSVKSLSLIDRNEYYRLYSQLKQKYSEHLFSIWCEVTDPQKYIFEDLGIAAYLLLLWQKFSPGKQKFVDLGCGNGLLVYILSNEGHFGVGIDVRARKIWEIYPKSEMILKVATVTTTENCEFPEADWIIGNHSDELSPWIPVIAAKSSFKTKFFLLPCCAYEFNGQKYRRGNSKTSVYEDFFVYVTEISRICGFRVEHDRLAIPSTKRNAVIGVTRVHDETKMEDFLKEIQNFIEERTKNCEKSDFRTRESVEVVKNCTKIDREVVSTIALKVFNELLTKKRFVPDLPEWNTGGNLALTEVIGLLNDSERKILKENAGGLQTLLKNHPSVFKIQRGQVSIRVPVKTKLSGDKLKFYKKADCWFFKHHPQKCPLKDEDCTYKHEF